MASATITNKQRPAHTWREYVSSGAANGQTNFPTGYATLAVTLKSGTIAARDVYPSMVIAQTAGLVVIKDREGTERAFNALAGVPYPLQAAQFDGTNTTADNVLFLYNA